MEKAHLLLGSIGLFVVIAQMLPAFAANDASSTSASKATTTSALSTHSIVAGT